MRERLWLAVFVVALLAGDAAAQRDETHIGLSLAFALGRGNLTMECKTCETSGQGDVSFFGRAGWTLRPGLVVGLEGLGVQKAQIVDGETATATYMWGGLTAVWHPGEYSDGFLKAGAGFSSSEARFFVAGFGNVDLSLSAPTFLLGIGYDIRMGRTFSITPFVDYHLAIPGDGDIDGAPSSIRMKSNLLNIGVGLTLH